MAGEQWSATALQECNGTTENGVKLGTFGEKMLLIQGFQPGLSITEL